MSDFLTNLAVRVLGAPALRPRLRSRFEPAPAAAGIALETAPPRREQERMTRVEVAGEPPRRMVIGAVPAVPRSMPQRQPPPLVPGETKRPVEDDHTSPPASADSATHPPPPPAAAPPQQRRIAAAVPPVVTASRGTPPAHVLTESIVETREIIVREAGAPDAASTQPAPPPALPRHRYDEQPPRIERTVVSREALFANAPPRPARASQSRMDVPAPSEPVIQVSIGRVEVRAVTPPPAAKPNRAPRAAAMTIDDYAARRNAKGRR
jgi:hypothetical protein